MILRTVARLMLPILALFSIFLLLRGGDLPGGGFAGGLVAAAAVILQMVANDVGTARRLLGIEPQALLPIGLGLAVASAALPLVWGLPFMTSRFVHLAVPGGETFELGLPTLFDTGVYLVVLGMALLVVLSVAEEEE